MKWSVADVGECQATDAGNARRLMRRNATLFQVVFFGEFLYTFRL